MRADSVLEAPERRGPLRRKGRRRVLVNPGCLETVTGDLSVGGVFVITGQVQVPGTPVDMTFPSADGEIRVSGVVRWVRRSADPERPERAAGMGIEFREAHP